jgi:hypothetical protein
MPVEVFEVCNLSGAVFTKNFRQAKKSPFDFTNKVNGSGRQSGLVVSEFN